MTATADRRSVVGDNDSEKTVSEHKTALTMGRLLGWCNIVQLLINTREKLKPDQQVVWLKSQTRWHENHKKEIDK